MHVSKLLLLCQSELKHMRTWKPIKVIVGWWTSLKLEKNIPAPWQINALVSVVSNPTMLATWMLMLLSIRPWTRAVAYTNPGLSTGWFLLEYGNVLFLLVVVTSADCVDQASLTANAKPGRTMLTVSIRDQVFTLCTLTQDKVSNKKHAIRSIHWYMFHSVSNKHSISILMNQMKLHSSWKAKSKREVDCSMCIH